MSVTVRLRRSLIAAFAAGLAGAALVAAGDARAQAKLDAHYRATLAGVPIGEGTWTIELAEDRYSAVVQGATSGIIKMFTGGRGTGSVRGVRSGGLVLSSMYSAQITTNRKSDEVEIVVDAGAVKEFKVKPPIDDDPARVPITASEREGITDPMSGSILHVNGNGNVLASENCQRTIPVFDGRLRYNLKFVFKRMDNVRADKGYAGPALVCSVYFAPVAGFIPDRAAIKYLVRMRDAEVWLVPVQGTRVLVPFRLQVPTPLGTGVLEATQFVAVAQPQKASVKNPKSQ